MLGFIKEEIQKTKAVLGLIEQDTDLLKAVETVGIYCTQAIQQGGKIMFIGNGGSAADSQHLAAELVSRLRYNRPGIAGLALTTDTSALTAIANDYSFEYVFARQVEAMGQRGDVLIGISTSGKSPNILKAFEAAQARGIITIGMSGKHSPLMAEFCQIVLNAPVGETAKIQECHILFGHIICALIEESIYGKDYNPKHKASLEA